VKKTPLTDEQERMRLDGLRALARIIARHALSQPARDGAGPKEPRRASASDEPDHKDGAA